MKVIQSCPTLCDPLDDTVHGILQARILEAFPFSRGFSQLRDRTQISGIAGGFFTSWATKEVCYSDNKLLKVDEMGVYMFLSLVTQSCPTLCDSMDCSTLGLPAHHQPLEFTQTHVHWVGDAIQLSHPLSSPSPPAFSLAPSIRVFSNESALCIRGPKYWRFSFKHQSFQIIQDWFPLRWTG